jgi:hypothetical protein
MTDKPAIAAPKPPIAWDPRSTVHLETTQTERQQWYFSARNEQSLTPEDTCRLLRDFTRHADTISRLTAAFTEVTHAVENAGFELRRRRRVIRGMDQNRIVRDD